MLNTLTMYTYRFGGNFTTTHEELTGYDERVIITEEEALLIEQGANIEISEESVILDLTALNETE